MFLEQRINTFSPPAFNLATNTILGTSQSWPIDRTWPIEEIVLHVAFTVTTALVMTPTAAATQDAYDNILQILQRANLTMTDGKNPRSVIDCSGVGLLEHCSQVGFKLDAATEALIGSSETVGLPVGAYEITYRIPMVNPMVGEPLRTRMYLPAHRLPQDPVLKLTFNTVAGMGCSAGVIGAVFCDVQLIRRLPTPESERLLLDTAPLDQAGEFKTGYIPFDLVETPYGIPLGSAAEFRAALPVPGNYLSLLMRQYLGGATYSRNVIDNSGIGDTVAHGFGSETLWRLETGQSVLRQWKWKHLRANNDWSRAQVGNPQNVFVAAASAGAITTGLNVNPNFGGPLIAATNFRAASSTLHNFLLDGMSGDTGTELGSLLDCNSLAKNSLKMELVGTPASVATNASYLYVVGHRLFGDISRWQKFA
jgi:hypothetical protein